MVRQASSRSYCFGPTRICSAWVLVLCALNVTSLASTPSSWGAETKASAAGSNSVFATGSTCISTFCAATLPSTGCPIRTIAEIPTPWTPQCACRQPELFSTCSRSHTKSACSPSPSPIPISKLIPENGLNLSAIRVLASFVINERRGALNLTSSNCAAAAFSFASAVRASYWANCLSPASLALCPKKISP